LGSVWAAETKTYHLKDGSKIVGRQLGKSGGRIMIKREDGKSVFIQTDDVTKVEAGAGGATGEPGAATPQSAPALTVPPGAVPDQLKQLLKTASSQAGPLPLISVSQRHQACGNKSQGGLCMVDTSCGRTWHLIVGRKQWVRWGTPSGAKPGVPGTYVPLVNKSGAGIFVVNSATGQCWWANGHEWAYWGTPTGAKPSAPGTYTPCENMGGAGMFVVNTATAQCWWTNGHEWETSGKLEGTSAKPGPPGMYVPVENRTGGGLFIINAATGAVWWSLGKQSQSFGTPSGR